MKPDRNRAKLGGAVAPIPQSPLMFPEHDWETADLTHSDGRRTEQQAIKESVNDPNISSQLAARQQVPNPPSDASQFQPLSGAKIGDMVTGQNRKGGGDDRPEVVAGTLMSGGSAVPPRPPHVPIQDWPIVRVVPNAPNNGQEL